jgi:hypothetical protein
LKADAAMLADTYSTYSTYADPANAARLLADCTAQAVTWRWATESMGEQTPFLQEQYGGPKPRWLADDKADPECHVHHGFDAAGRLVLQRQSRGRATAWLHEADRSTGVQLQVYDGEPSLTTVTQYRRAGGLLASQHVSHGHKGFDTRYEWQDAQLQHAVLNTTDDFVVAHADNTGEIDPLKAMKAAIAPERWALLKARGLV